MCDLLKRPLQFFEQHSPLGASRIIADAEHFAKHLDDAVDRAVYPSARVWEKSPKDLQDAVRFVSSYRSHPSALIQRRATIRGVIEQVARVLRPLSDSIAAHAPEHVRSPPTSINIAFLSALAKAISFPDRLLPAKIALWLACRWRHPCPRRVSGQCQMGYH